MITGRRTIVGLCLLCALLVSALAAQAASAVSQTAVECTNSGTPLNSDRFSDAHCKTLATGQPFFHAATPVNTPIASEGTNATTGGGSEPGILKANISGVTFSIEFTEFTLDGGTIENKEAGGEMYAEGVATAIHLANAAMTSPSPSCVVSGVPPSGIGAETPGTILTQPVRATTKGQLQGIIKFEPQSGSKLAEFTITGTAPACPAAVQGAYPIFGTVTSSKTEGATVPFKHATVTATKSLRLLAAGTGPVAGLEGKVTVKKTSGGVPIALT